MRNSSLFLFILILFSSFNLIGQKGEIEKTSFKVWGNCEMCKEKIESTVSKVQGIKSVKWNMVTQKINIKFYPDSSTINSIQKTIASIGYDTEKFKAKDVDYNGLHSCCKYNRN